MSPWRQKSNPIRTSARAILVGLLNRLGQPHPVFCHAAPLGEAPQFGQTPGHNATGEHRGRGDQAKARIAQLAGEQRHHLSRHVQRLLKVSHGTVGHAQVVLGHDLDVKRATGRGQGEGPLASRHSPVMLAHDIETVAQGAGDPPEPLVVAQPLGEGLGGAQVIEHPCKFPEWPQGIAQV
jgi:hypothetical protein